MLKENDDVYYELMCVIMVDPATSMLEMEEIPTVVSVNKKCILDKVFDGMSA